MFEKTGYNYPSNPTVRNTCKDFYNCGGYALNLFRWYVPAKSWADYDDIEQYLEDEEYDTATSIAIEYMCKTLHYSTVSSWEIMHHRIDYKKYEIVASRYEMVGSGSDFHFMKIGKNGNWYEKRGCGSTIYRHEYDYVFKIWAHRYDGPIVFLIKERGT